MYICSSSLQFVMFLDDQVFKNKEYGGYVLRKNYIRYTSIAFFISVFIYLLAFSIPLLFSFKKQLTIDKIGLKTKSVPMEFMDIKIDIPEETKNFLTQENGEAKIKLNVPQQHSVNDEVILDYINKTNTNDTANITNIDKSNDEITIDSRLLQEGVFECGSNLFNFRMWFMQHFQFPDLSGVKKTEGKVIAVFWVNEEGIVDSVNIVSGVDPAIDKEVKKVLLSAPRFKPCYLEGKKVKQLYHFPIYFVRKI